MLVLGVVVSWEGGEGMRREEHAEQVMSLNSGKEFTRVDTGYSSTAKSSRAAAAQHPAKKKKLHLPLGAL